MYLITPTWHASKYSRGTLTSTKSTASNNVPLSGVYVPCNSHLAFESIQGALNSTKAFNDVPLVEFMYLLFTLMPRLSVSYRKRLGSEDSSVGKAPDS